MEPWESLDIDDSDLRPLSRPLLPCKRPQLEPSPPKTHRIPGPAGTVQAAMHRKAHNEVMVRENFSSTQEFLRRAIEEDAANAGQDDDDFKKNSWICAVGFVGDDGFDSLEAIKSRVKRGVDQIPQVVAMVKSCSPNGLGDLILTLKDPTGTMGANIHRKVLTDTEFGKDISVGSVLILEKVVVFSPSPTAYYLNVTQKNITKVFSKDSGPPTSNCRPVSQVRAVASVAGLHKNPTNLNFGTVERITNESVRAYTKYNRSVGVDRANEHNLVAGKFSRTLTGSSSQNSAVEVESLRTQNARREVTIEPSKGDTRGRETMLNRQAVNIASQASSAAEPIGKNSNDDRATGSATEALKQKPQLISRTALPEWTDEQLEELFAASCEDW